MGYNFPTDRSWWKLFLLNMVTFGIYGIIFYTKVGDQMNALATKRDGKNTMNYCLVFFLLGPITGGIMTLIWIHTLCDRIGAEARARGIQTDFSATTFWLWGVLGSFIVVGPFIHLHKMCEALNAISAHANQYQA